LLLRCRRKTSTTWSCQAMQRALLSCGLSRQMIYAHVCQGYTHTYHTQHTHTHTHTQARARAHTHTHTHAHTHTHTLFSKDEVRPVVRTPRLRLSCARGTQVTQLGTVMTPRRRSPRSLAMTPRSARFTGDSFSREILPTPWSLVYFLFLCSDSNVSCFGSVCIFYFYFNVPFS
jgi:hypothetical protein